MFASSCQHFFIPILVCFENVNFWPNQWFQMIREGKSAIAYILGLVCRTDIILTSNHFIYQAAKIYFSLCSALLSLLSFSILSGFWPLYCKQSIYPQIKLSYFVRLPMIHHSKLKKGHIFTSSKANMDDMLKINKKSENINKWEFFKKLFAC